MSLWFGRFSLPSIPRWERSISEMQQSRLQPAIVNADVQKAAGRVHRGLHPAIPNQQLRVGICKGPCLLRINALLELILELVVSKQ